MEMRKLTLHFFLFIALIGLSTADPGFAKFREKRGNYRITLEGKSWSLLFKIPGFHIDVENSRSDGSGAGMRAIHDDTGVLVSVFLELSPEFHSAEECRDHYWARTVKGTVRRTNIEFRRTETMAVVESMVKDFQGTPVMQKNINAYLFRDGVCIDVQVSKVFYEPDEEALLTAILDTVRFSRKRSPDDFCQ